jgi:ACR3 family arsenite transporter
MVGLGLLFFEVFYRSWVNPADAREYVAGMILLGAAPCTAMVFVWSQLTRGDETYTLVQVSVNDLIMVFAFAPLVALLLGVADVVVPWSTLLLSVVLYVVVPLAAGYFTRRALISRGGDRRRVAAFSAKLKPYTIAGLLATVVLLFAFQGPRILEQPLLIALIAAPLVVQSYGIFLIAYGWAWGWGLPFSIAAPAALIGTSNFFELAVAVAISLFGLESGAALATVVGVLVEVPVMLSLVALANRTQHHFPRTRAQSPSSFSMKRREKA